MRLEEEQRFFARSIKEAFGFETFFQLLEGELQRALPTKSIFLDVNLIFAALFVDADGAAHGDLQTRLGRNLMPRCCCLSKRSGLGAVVLRVK